MQIHFYTVYKTTNTTNGKFYIGKHKTRNPNDDYLGSGLLLRRAIAKYGRQNFKKEVLAVFNTQHEMDVCEQSLVTPDFCLRDDTYNLNEGGQGTFDYINRMGRQGYSLYPELAKANRRKSDQTKHLWKRLPGEYTHSEETREKIRKNRRNMTDVFHHTEQTRQKMSKSKRLTAKGVGNSQFGSIWITNGTENKKIKAVDPIPEGWYRGRKFG